MNLHETFMNQFLVFVWERLTRNDKALMETGTQNKFLQEIVGNNVSKMMRDWRSPKQGF